MWPNPQEAADLVTFTEEILNGKLLFLCSDNIINFITRASFTKTVYLTKQMFQETKYKY